MVVNHHGINLSGEVRNMHLLLTIEAQNGTENGLNKIMWEIICQLKFVTDTNAGLENINNYGTEFRSIAIIPICIDDNFWDILGWKERKQIWRQKREADIRLRMNYERFIRETPEKKRLMFIDIIIKSIKVIQERSKGDFRGNDLISDILKALKVTQNQLTQLNIK